MGVFCMIWTLIDWIVEAAFGIWNQLFRSHTRLPGIADDALLSSVTDLARDIRSRQRTAVDVVKAFVDRIKVVNPTLNCMVADRFDAALSEAAEVDALLDADPYADAISESKKPLLGVPFTSKDFFAIKGLPNACGFIQLKDRVATEDAVAVTRMREAGAIPLGITNVPELCMWWETSNVLYGRTNNVYDNRRIVGGSSGGEGCLISAGGSVIGLGSDIGGSVRLPSMFNGVFGHKPTRYMVPNLGQYPHDPKENSLNNTGPLCRYATDLLPVLKVLAGEENSKTMKLDEKIDLNKIKLKVYSAGLKELKTSPEQAAMQRRVATALERRGAVVEERVFPEFADFFDLWGAAKAATGAHSFCSLMGLRHREPGSTVNPTTELFKWMLGMSNHTYAAILLGRVEAGGGGASEEKLRADVERAKKLERDINELLGDDGILLCPTTEDYAYYHDHPLYTKFDPLYTMIFNVTGSPVTQVPLGLGRKGVPLGLQVVAGHGQDRLSIAVAEFLEKEFGGWVNPSNVS